MFETFFFIVIQFGSVTLKEGSGQTVLPQELVNNCAQDTRINPFVEKELSDPLNELTFLDCVFHQQGRY